MKLEKYSESKSVAESRLDDWAPEIQATPIGDDSGEWNDLPEETRRKYSKLSNKLPKQGKL